MLGQELDVLTTDHFRESRGQYLSRDEVAQGVETTYKPNAIGR